MLRISISNSMKSRCLIGANCTTQKGVYHTSFPSKEEGKLKLLYKSKRLGGSFI